VQKIMSRAVGASQKHLKKIAGGVAAVAAFVGVQVQAAIDTTEVATNLTAAQATAQVLGFVAALVVVGICIALVKKA
jgi:hypothetical protein